MIRSLIIISLKIMSVLEIKKIFIWNRKKSTRTKEKNMLHNSNLTNCFPPRGPAFWTCNHIHYNNKIENIENVEFIVQRTINEFIFDFDAVDISIITEFKKKNSPNF